MKPLAVLNEFFNSGYTNVDFQDVMNACDEIENAMLKSDYKTASCVLHKISDIRIAAETMKMMRRDKQWEKLIPWPEANE